MHCCRMQEPVEHKGWRVLPGHRGPCSLVRGTGTSAFLKGNQWVKPYWCKMRCRSKSQLEEVQSWVAVALPHEYIAVLGRFGSLEALQDTSGLDAVSLQHLSKVRDELGEPAIGCGLWMDGVPCQWDRDQSIEVCALSFPGAAAGTKGAGMRLPVMGLMKSQMTKSTFVDLMEVLLWSFMHLATGCWPAQRHDAQPWLASDSKRRQCTGQLGFVGCCLQIRALPCNTVDWLS